MFSLYPWCSQEAQQVLPSASSFSNNIFHNLLRENLTAFFFFFCKLKITLMDSQLEWSRKWHWQVLVFAWNALGNSTGQLERQSKKKRLKRIADIF
jgi:nucleoside permease NupC